MSKKARPWNRSDRRRRRERTEWVGKLNRCFELGHAAFQEAVAPFQTDLHRRPITWREVRKEHEQDLQRTLAEFQKSDTKRG